MDEVPVGSCGRGLLILLGVASGDDASDAERMAAKIAKLRIFEGESGKLDLSILDTAGEALVVSQFTLSADTAKGNRPSFTAAAAREVAGPLVDRFCEVLRERGVPTPGAFGARMAIELVNDGPVTIVLDG